MQCSCGSSSFAASSLKHLVSDQACVYMFSACKSCGRQGDHQLADEITGKVLATGMDTIRSVQQDKLITSDMGVAVEIESTDPLSVHGSGLLGDQGVVQALPPESEAPARPSLIDIQVPSKEHLSYAEKGKPLHDRGRHYYLWESDTHQVRLKYHHHIYDNGAEEVSFPAFNLVDNRKAEDDANSVLMSSLALIKDALERHFDEPTKSTSITCAPPQGDWLEVSKNGKWVPMLMAEPSIEPVDSIIEVEPIKDLVSQDSELPVIEVGASSLAIDEIEEPEDLAVQEDSFDPLAVSSQQKDSKESVQMSLF